MDIEQRGVYDVELELREGGRSISGRFPYGSMATVASRGRVRKERFSPGAFRFAIEDPAREINLLSGHDFDKPLASKRAGTLEMVDERTGVIFNATLPVEGEQPTWMRDAVLSIKNGLFRGISPGFQVPPASAVRKAEELLPEPGNPAVQIRQIHEAVLIEMSTVTRPAYQETALDVRSEEELVVPRKVYWWL